jgi:CRP/FNR family transcriptional activator FtrB
MRPGDLELARRLPVFAELSPAAVDGLINGAFVQSLPRGTILCTQGEMPEFLHAIISGRVALLGQGPDRSETVIEFFEAGDLLILPAVLLAAPYLMSARVVADARVLFIPAERVRRTMKSEPDFARAAALHLSQHWRRVIRQVKDLKLRTAAERLAAFIVAQAPKDADVKSIQLPEDRKMIAARLGMTPESLSRAFAALRAIGVGGRGRTVTVASLHRLREICRYDDLA